MPRYRSATIVHALLASLCLLIGSGSLRCSAQTPPEQPDTGGQTGVRPQTGRSFEGTPSKPPEYFEEFEKRLNGVLNAHGVDPENHTFHFAILFNCTDPQSGGYDHMRDIMFGMLRDYLADVNGVSDHVSFVPYQLMVREDKVVWDQPFSRTAAEDLYKQIPDTPVDPPGYHGGRDMGNAIIAARDFAKAKGELDQTVFIVLTDGKYYGSPIAPTNYSLIDRDPDLKKDGIVKAADEQNTWTLTNKNGSTTQVSAFYRIYCPQNLKPLGVLPSPGRTHIVEQPWQPAAQSGNATDSNTASSHTADSNVAGNKPGMTNPGEKNPGVTKPSTSKAAPTKPSDSDPTPLIVGGILLACVLALCAYLFWITRPRSIQVGVNNLRSASVVFRKPLYLGTSEDEQGNMLKLDSLPDDVPAKEKLARLEVTPLGALVVHSQRWTVTGAPVTVAVGDRKKVQVSRTSSTGLLGSSDSIEVTIIKNR